MTTALLRSSLLAAIASLAFTVQTVRAESPTLQKIARTGTINLGHRESAIPFSYYDARKQVVGYSQDLMLKVTEDIRKHLRLPALTIRMVPITAVNRIDMVQSGAVDIECGSTTHNKERDQLAGFSVSIFQTNLRMLTHAASRVNSIDDVKNQTIVVTAGTTSEKQLQQYSSSKKLPLQISAARDYTEAFMQLQKREAAAFLVDEALLYGLRALADNPDNWRVIDAPFTSEVYACMFRKDDPEFKAVVDQSLRQIMRSGEVMRIYRKWFQSPIPPKGINLHWQAPQSLLNLYANPNDLPLN